MKKQNTSYNLKILYQLIALFLTISVLVVGMLTSVFFANFLGLSTPIEASSTSPKDVATNLNRSKDLKKLSLTIEQDLNPTAVNYL